MCTYIHAYMHTYLRIFIVVVSSDHYNSDCPCLLAIPYILCTHTHICICMDLDIYMYDNCMHKHTCVYLSSVPTTITAIAPASWQCLTFYVHTHTYICIHTYIHACMHTYLRIFIVIVSSDHYYSDCPCLLAIPNFLSKTAAPSPAHRYFTCVCV